jgi:hypothetical protein
VTIELVAATNASIANRSSGVPAPITESIHSTNCCCERARRSSASGPAA